MIDGLRFGYDDLDLGLIDRVFAVGGFEIVDFNFCDQSAAQKVDAVFFHKGQLHQFDIDQALGVELLLDGLSAQTDPLGILTLEGFDAFLIDETDVVDVLADLVGADQGEVGGNAGVFVLDAGMAGNHEGDMLIGQADVFGSDFRMIITEDKVDRVSQNIAAA